MGTRGQDNDLFTTKCTSWQPPTSRGTTTDNRVRAYLPRDIEDGMDNTPSHHNSPPLSVAANYHAAVKQPDSTMPAKARLIKRPQSSGETHSFSYSVPQKLQLNMDRHFGAPKAPTKELDDNGMIPSNGDFCISTDPLCFRNPLASRRGATYRGPGRRSDGRHPQPTD